MQYLLAQRAPRQHSCWWVINMHDQRRNQRIQRAVVRVDSIRGQRIPVQVQDFSQGGICLATSVWVEVGERLDLALAEGSDNRPHHLKARVQWRRGALVGLAWVGLTPEEQQWVNGLIGFWLGMREPARW